MIAFFDSGYGGLTIFSAVRRALPAYDYVYLGDNARAPYGPRSFEVVYRFTLQAVARLLGMGADLVILACNTASAKALRTIQQRDLPRLDPAGGKRVLGIIRPSAEALGRYTATGRVGVMATEGTVTSESYVIEMRHLWPSVEVFQQACPLWVPLVESDEFDNPGADYFVEKYTRGLLAQSADIDTIMLACTHYPLLAPKISRLLPGGVRLLSQGGIVADSLADYLRRHPEMERRLSRGGTLRLLTTGSADRFAETAGLFFDGLPEVTHIDID